MGWYRFEGFELDLDAFALKRGGESIRLQPKVFDVLRYLVDHRGRMVTKEELLDHLWNGEHVNEAAVAWSISHIRRALGQQRGDKHPIETVHGRGYRFTAEVTSGESGSGSSRSSTPQQPRFGSSFVGRERVMSVLQDHVRRATGGRGSLCVLLGEAGIGKTRCVEELVQGTDTLGVLAISGRCPQEPAAPALWPIASALSGRSGSFPDVAARARAILSEAGASAEDAERSERVSFATIEELARLLGELAAKQPLLLTLDDLHWADTSTLRLLAFLAPELREMRLCIVVTLREGERQAGSPHDQLLQQLLRNAYTLSLGALDTEQVIELMQVIARHRPSEGLAEAVRRAAGGVPLFVHEIVRSLVLEHGEQAIEKLGAEAVRVPELARDLLRLRIHRLPGQTTEALSRAAVIGDSFDLSLLLAVMELEPEVLLDRLEPALVAGHIVMDAPHSYRFSHSLFQAVLYDDLSSAVRVQLHRKVGTLLSQRADDPMRHGEAARHFYLSLPAGDGLLVMQQARKAGRALENAHAYDQAISCYTWALEAQAYGAPPDPRVRGELLFALANVQRAAGRTLDSTNTTTRVLELAEQQPLDDLVVKVTRLRRPTIAMAMLPDNLARAALERVLEHLPDEPSATRVSALAQLAHIPPFTPDLARSKSLSARAEALAAGMAGSDAMLEALRSRLFALSGPSDIDALLEVTDRMLALNPSAQHRFQRSEALSARYTAHVLAGRIADADAALEQLTTTISDQHWPEATFYCHRLAAQRRFLDGEFDEAERRWQTIRKNALRAGVSYADMFYGSQLSALRLDREGPKAVIQQRAYDREMLATGTPLMRALAAAVAARAGETEYTRQQLALLGDPSSYPQDAYYLHMLASMATCAAHIGDKPRCEQLFALLSPYADFNTPSPMGYYLGAVSYFLALVSAGVGRTVAAGSFFDRALERNRAMGYRAGVVYTLVAHGKLAIKLGNKKLARERLSEAQKHSAEIGMQAALAESTELLASC